MAVYVSYPTTTAARLDDAPVLPHASGQPAWTPNFAPLHFVMPAGSVKAAGTTNSGFTS